MARRKRKEVPSDYLTRLGEVDFDQLRASRPKSVTLNSEKYTFDEKAAARAVRFIETFCRHYLGDLAGELMILEPWQKWIVEELFGWKRSDGRRRYRKAFIMIPRKNGKTQLIAAIALYLMMADGEPGAKIFAAAADKEQARLLFDAAAMMIQQDDTLSEECVLLKDSFKYPATQSVTQVLSSTPKTKHGLNAHGVLLDELHAHESRELYDVLTTSRGSRRQPLAISITTAGVYDENSVCYQEYQVAKRVAANPESLPTFLPVIFEAPQDADWQDESVWFAANPALRGGNMIQLEYLREQCMEAKENPAFENTFRQLHLNQWTEQAVRAIPMNRWKDCIGEAPFDLAGRRCFVGIDLSQKLDLTCVVELYPFGMPPSEQASDDLAKPWGFFVRAHFWTPSANLQRRERIDNASYGLWAKRGGISIVEGSVIPEWIIEAHLRQLLKDRNVERIVFDRWGMAGIGSRLRDEYGDEMVAEQRQGFHLSPAWGEMMAAMSSGRFIHEPNDTLDYCAANIAVKTDNLGNVCPIKSQSSGRIDGVVAMLTGLSHLMRSPGESIYRKSIYDTEGVMVL